MSRIQSKFIAANAITNSKLAQMVQSTIKGRAAAAGTGDPVDLTATQVTAILNIFTSSLQGLVPASGGGTTNFLRADGTFAAPTASSSAPTLFGTRGSPRSIVAATGITSGASHMSTTAPDQKIYAQGSVTGDSIVATITAGTVDGAALLIQGRSDTQTLSLTSATTNISLRGNITLGADDMISLSWDGTFWAEVSRNN